MTAALHGPFVYLGIAAAAMVEGEVTYVAASALVAEGHLNAFAVILAGAAGAAMGDQFYFYLLRRRLTRWVGRVPAISRRTQRLTWIVKRHQTAMVLLIRFLPGLRIALAATCAYLDVNPLRFSLLNAAAALVWALVLLAIVAYVGPTYLSRVGLSGWEGALVSGVLIIVALHIIGRIERRRISTTLKEGALNQQR